MLTAKITTPRFRRQRKFDFDERTRVADAAARVAQFSGYGQGEYGLALDGRVLKADDRMSIVPHGSKLELVLWS